MYINIYNQLGYTCKHTWGIFITGTYFFRKVYIYIIYIYVYIYIYIYTSIIVYMVYIDISNICLPSQLLFPRSSIYNIVKVCYNN